MLSIFSCAYWPSVCLLWRNVSLDPLFIFWLGWFFCCWDGWALCIFWKLSLCWSHHLQIFFPSVWLSSQFLEHKFSTLMKYNLPNIYFIDHIFSFASKKPLPYPRSSIILKYFYRLSFYFRSVIYFELKFVKDKVCV